MATPRIAKPRLACEITSQNVIAARANANASGLEVHSVRRLEPDMVRPSMSAGNIANPSGLSQSIAGALAAVGGRKRDVVAILPDASVRVLLMDFDVLPEKAAEAEPIIRFRLRKSVPFDADQAALSFQTYRKQGVVKVLAAVTPREVLNEYESAFRSAGYEPGYVLPSTLAVLNAIEAGRPTLLVKSDGNFISVAIADANEVVFYRMLDVVPNRTGAAIADEVYPSIVFFEDNYSAKIEHILLASNSDSADLKEALREQTGLRPETFDPGVSTGDGLSGDGVPAAALAGVAGVLTHQ
jgi:type IV pilus assembly protein PilM